MSAFPNTYSTNVSRDEFDTNSACPTQVLGIGTNPQRKKYFALQKTYECSIDRVRIFKTQSSNTGLMGPGSPCEIWQAGTGTMLVIPHTRMPAWLRNMTWDWGEDSARHWGVTLAYTEFSGRCFTDLKWG